MFPKMFPKVFRKISLSPGSTVEERRFSAASTATDDAGFSPCGRISRPSQSSPQLPTHTVKNFLATTLVVIALVVASLQALAQNSKGASATADLPPGSMQAKATTSCLECHEASIILQQRLNKAAWTKEVDKMTKWGAVVDPTDRDALIDYLSTNFSPDKPAYDPQRTSAVKNGSGKTK